MPNATTKMAVKLRNVFSGSLYMTNRSNPLGIDIRSANKSSIPPFMIKMRDLKSSSALEVMFVAEEVYFERRTDAICGPPRNNTII